MAHRLTTQIEEWTEKALDEQALGDRVTWDCAFALTEQGPQMLMAFFMPGALLGTAVQSGVVLQNVSQASEYDIQETVKRILEDLRQNRSEQIAESEKGPQLPLFAPQGG